MALSRPRPGFEPPWGHNATCIRTFPLRRTGLMKAKHVKYTSAIDAIGNTPIIKFQKIVPDSCANVYAKLESYNPTGSKKDRMALAMI
tara:strand:+ start:383 stop:646 length:264 start_codon:yes stop_codon:yes gene_type:complete